MTTIGAVFIPQFAPERLRGVAQAADDAGLPELWLWEDCFLYGGMASAAAALAWTERVRVGIGLTPAPFRNVAVAAMEAATLERLFPDRLVLAAGHGVQRWMAQVGAKVESPMTLLREYATALQALLRGETVTVSGRYVSLDAVSLDWPPAATGGVHIGAVGPRTLKLAGELGDGTILEGGTTPDGVRSARTHIEAGRARAGRSDPHRITVYLPTATGLGAQERLAAIQAKYGFAPGAQSGAAGSADEVAAAVRRWADAGADAVILQPLEDEPDPVAFMRFASGVARLV